MNNLYIITKLSGKRYYRKIRLDNWNMIYKADWRKIIESLNEDMKIELCFELSGDEIKLNQDKYT